MNFTWTKSSKEVNLHAPMCIGCMTMNMKGFNGNSLQFKSRSYTRSQGKLHDARPYNNSTIKTIYQFKTQINQKVFNESKPLWTTQKRWSTCFLAFITITNYLWRHLFELWEPLRSKSSSIKNIKHVLKDKTTSKELKATCYGERLFKDKNKLYI